MSQFKLMVFYDCFLMMTAEFQQTTHFQMHASSSVRVLLVLQRQDVDLMQPPANVC